MENIIIFSKDNFFNKNLTEYVIENNLNYKLIFFKDLKSIHDIKKIKRLSEKNYFTVINLGLSGSIQFNIKNGANIYKHNIELYYRVIQNLKNASIKNLYFVSASCCYPKNKNLLEEKLYGYPPLEETSFFYSLSKIFGSEICRQINIDKKFNYVTLVPATLYGKYSKYHEENSHVLTSILNKIDNKKKKISFWGTGIPRREFIFMKDFIDGIFFVRRKKIRKPVINVGTGLDYSIKELTNIVKKIKNSNVKILWDSSKKDGSKKKLLNSKYLFSKGWRPKRNLTSGIKETLGLL